MMNTQTGAKHKDFLLRNNYFKMENYLEQDGHGMEMLLLGLINQPAERSDRLHTRDVTDHLFPEDNHRFGADLVARNLQRGRDHGLPGWNDFRAYCGLPKLSLIHI